MQSILKGGNDASRALQERSAQEGLPIRQGRARRQSAQAVGVAVLDYAKAHPGRLLLMWLAAVAGVRLGLVLSYDGFLGVDSGAYALGFLQFFGGPGAYMDTHFSRPPLDPGFLYYPFWLAFGISPTGLNLYAGIFSLAVIPGFYLLAQRILGPRWGALATVGITLDWPLAEMLVTGVVPVTGFGMLALTLWGMLGVAGGYQARRWHWAAVILGVPLIAHTNHTTAGLALITIPIAWLMLPNKRALTLALVGGAILALTALPWYMDVMPGAPRVSYPGPLVYPHPWWSAQWIIAAGSLAVGLAVLRLRRHWNSYITNGYELNDSIKVTQNGVRIMAVVLMAHGALQVFLSYDEALINIFFRSSYWLSIPFWICATYLAARAVYWLKPSRAVVAAAAAVFLAVGIYGVQDEFYGQAYYSDLAGPDVLAALESIPPDEITRLGTNAESRGFYLAALTQKPVLWVQNALPGALYAEFEYYGRCSLGWVDDCETRGYVSHWIVDTKNRQQIDVIVTRAPDPERPWVDLGANAPWLEKTFEQGTVEVWTHRDL